MSAAESPLETKPPSIWRRIRRDALLLGAGSLGVALTQLVFRAILVAALDPPSYGRLSLVLSIYTFVLIIGLSGLPNAAARHISLITPADDSPVVKATFRAAAFPTLVACAAIAGASGFILNSPLAFVNGSVGLGSLIYALIITGILRGRGRVVCAASVMMIGGVSEVLCLVGLIISGLSVTSQSAFAVFCLGNVIGLVAAWLFLRATGPKRMSRWTITPPTAKREAPSSRELLGFSTWLAATALGIAILPLVVRLAASFSSYTIVAMVDVALVLLSVPLRLGTVIVSAAVPHASRAVDRGEVHSAISRKEQAIVILPFLIAALIVTTTPIVEFLFGLIGRPEYSTSSPYIAMALVAGPARVLYGLVEGVLVAHLDGRALATNSVAIAVVASPIIVLLGILGSMEVSFGVFVIACWAVYIFGLFRLQAVAANRA